MCVACCVALATILYIYCVLTDKMQNMNKNDLLYVCGTPVPKNEMDHIDRYMHVRMLYAVRTKSLSHFERSDSARRRSASGFIISVCVCVYRNSVCVCVCRRPKIVGRWRRRQMHFLHRALKSPARHKRARLSLRVVAFSPTAAQPAHAHMCT